MNKGTESPKFNPKPINMKYVESGLIDPNTIDRSFFVQRALEPSRLRIIKKSMGHLGYDMAKPVVLSQDDVAVDGNHRIHLAIENDYKEIPYVKYEFKTKNDAYRYFQQAQIQTMGMKARDELFAYLQTKHPYAVLLYSICENKHCQLSAAHDLKISPDDKPSNSAIKVENICYIINGILFKRKTGWSRSAADFLANKSVDIIGDPRDIQDAIQEINAFMKFFWNSFGWHTNKKEMMFKEHFLLAVLDLYTEILLPNPIFPSDQKKVESKLSKVTVDKDLTTNHKKAIMMALLRQINSKRTLEVRIYG